MTAACVLLLPLQGCSLEQLSVDCQRLQNVTYLPDTYSSLIRETQIDRKSSIFASKQQVMLSEQLAQIPLSDLTLNHHRSELVKLYRLDSDLGLQVSAFMTNSGQILVTGASRSAYEQVARQRIYISQQVQDIHNYIASYCGASEF